MITPNPRPSVWSRTNSSTDGKITESSPPKTVEERRQTLKRLAGLSIGTFFNPPEKQELNKEIDQTINELSAAINAKTTVQLFREQAEKKSKETEQKLTAVQKSEAQTQELYRKVKAELEVLRKTHDSKIKELARVALDLTRSNKEHAETKIKLGETKKELKQTTINSMETTEQPDAVKTELQTTKDELFKIKSALADRDSKIENLEETLTTHKERLQTATGENAKLKTRLSTRERDLRDARRDIEKLHKSYQAEVDGIHQAWRARSEANTFTSNKRRRMDVEESHDDEEDEEDEDCDAVAKADEDST